MASATGLHSSLLYAWDKLSGRRFLVDTGAEVSVLPATGLDTRTNPTGSSLKAANGSTITTYGVRTTKLHFGTHQYKWDFTVADVSRPLLGADFLRANSLLVDLHGKRLVHTETYHSTPLRMPPRFCSHYLLPQPPRLRSCSGMTPWSKRFKRPKQLWLVQLC